MRIALHSILDACTPSDEKNMASTIVDRKDIDDDKTMLSVVAMASTVLDSIARWGDHNFRIHPKGKGIVVDVASGVPNNRFVNEYLGEVYPSWLWSARQNVMDRLQQVCMGGPGKETTVLPDFWNMQLERHAEDDCGRLLFTIDPSHCANFSSRLSHSCTPNWVK